MKRPRQGSTIKQFAYATRMMSGQAGSKKEAALLSGFSLSVAENAKNKIESTEGFKNAMGVLAFRSNNLLVAVMNEFEARGLSKFSNKDLVAAMNAITAAWAKIDEKRAPDKLKTPDGNRLLGVLRRETKTETMIVASAPASNPDSANAEEPIHAEAIDMDF